jgi:hypothetical protein
VFAQRGLGTTLQFSEFQKKQGALPELVLPNKINTLLDAALFLEQHILPTLTSALQLPAANDLIPMMTYRNAAGYAFMTYYNVRKITLTGTEYGQYSGASLDLYGGLALAFGLDNRLKSAVYRPATDEDERQTRIMIRDLIREGVIGKPHDEQEKLPHALLLPDTTSTQPNDEKLVRYPLTVDPIQRFNDFADYVKRLAKQGE